MSYSDLGMQGGAVAAAQARTNPLDAFNDVFAGFTGGGTTRRLPTRDKLLVDRVLRATTRA